MGANEVTADRQYDGAARLTRLAWDQTANTLPAFNWAQLLPKRLSAVLLNNSL